MTANLESEASVLYERYGRPLEDLHWGEFVAISRSGGILLGSDLRQLVLDASKRLGKGNFVFKVGERAVGKLR